MRKKILFAAAFVATFAFAGTLFAAPRPANHTVFAELPPLTKIAVPAASELEIFPFARLDTSRVKECSALAKSRRHANVVWTLSDSGNLPTVFAVRETGEVVLPAGSRGNYEGVRLTGTRNIDWECLTLDERGNLIVGDVGNNFSNRRNLCFYIVPEPSPSAVVTPQRRKVSFYYPTQNAFPSPSRNYDCESCFALNGQIYFFTKHWTDTETVLWRVDPAIEAYQAAVPVARFDARGMVTDAAVSPSRHRLAVLTYHGVWVFGLPPADAAGKIDETKFFTSAPPLFRRLRVPAGDWQIEGITFADDETLLIAAEQGGLFRVPVADLAEIANLPAPQKVSGGNFLSAGGK